MTIITIKDCIDHSGYTKGIIPKGVWVKFLSVYTNFYGKFIDVQYCGERYSIKDGEFVVEWDKNDFDGTHIYVKCTNCGNIIRSCSTAIRAIPYKYDLTDYWRILKLMYDTQNDSRFDPRYKVTCCKCFEQTPATYNMRSYGSLPNTVIACDSGITDDIWKEYRNSLESKLRGIGYYD